MGQVISIRRGLALATAYPLPVDGVHLEAEDGGWRFTKNENENGASFSCRLSDHDLDLVIAMGQLALLVRQARVAPLGAVLPRDDVAFWSLTMLAFPGKSGVLVTLQQSVILDGRTVRLDVVLAAEGRCVAIELDGHDFHERTKDQASRDKSRDRLLVTAGWIVLRFTGSEVHTNPGGCLREAFVALRGKRQVA